MAPISREVHMRDPVRGSLGSAGTTLWSCVVGAVAMVVMGCFLLVI